MSNLIINIRFWYWHWQVTKGFKEWTFNRNSSIKSLNGMKKIEVFTFFN